MDLEKLSDSACFGGSQQTYRHRSRACDCHMQFAVYLPPAARTQIVPAVYWLSGLTCTEENFSVKSGAQRYAAELGLALIVPDTSPRGVDIPGQDEYLNVGTGAGFYVDATREPWSRHYRMYDYVSRELVDIVNAGLPVDPERKSISGHSMGGHGALVVALRNPQHYRSVSAFAPISSASQSAWGEQALSTYLGPDRAQWALYDAASLIRAEPSRFELLVDQGTADPYLDQLRPEALRAACRESGQRLNLRERSGYDHSYFFVGSFVGEHLEFHAKALA
jgi:S-formylglutathione hydrolase